ncbi:MAG: hypothetical protein ABIP75_05295 [Pyrinomonadaceae bacterium]
MIEKYVAHFGRPGDHALILAEDNEPVGAIWVRQFNANEPGCGFVDDATPELGIAIFARISLSVDKRNPAVRLYQRSGFEIIDEVDKGYTRLKTL